MAQMLQSSKRAINKAQRPAGTLARAIYLFPSK
jgi:hypothetical protein